MHLPPQQTLQDRQSVWPRVLWSHCSFSGFPCTRCFVCTLQMWSFCFTQSSGVHAINLISLHSLILWGLFLAMPCPSQDEEPCVELRTLTSVGETVWFPIFQFVGHPPSGYEIWFFCVPFLILLCGFFAFGWRIFFLVGSGLFCWHSSASR